jgi:3-deoxy-D-manno-octulosonate 8-phosphate phosphatase (KDO 8-P phosphatase)
MIFDVDGVLTDGTLWYGPGGEELKAFSAHDGHGIKLLAAGGVRIALLSGRRSKAVAARARELGIKKVFQGVDDKLSVFKKLLANEDVKPAAAGFMGDELVDLPVLSRCGFACAPQEAPEAVRSRVHYVTAAPAGRGAVREACELLLRARGFERLLQGHAA